MTGVIQDPEKRLDETERADMQALLAHPLDFPPEFKSWFADYVATNIPKLSVSQVFGFKVDRVQVATEITAAESTSSSAYVDLTTAGPQLTNLANGYYIVLFGCRVSALAGPSTANTRGIMSLSLNGSTPDDNDSAQTRFNPMFRSTLVRLTGNDVNTIKAQYKCVLAGATSITFERRFLAAMRVVNLDA